jgi:hypothetical protein
MSNASAAAGIPEKSRKYSFDRTLNRAGFVSGATLQIFRENFSFEDYRKVFPENPDQSGEIK